MAIDFRPIFDAFIEMQTRMNRLVQTMGIQSVIDRFNALPTLELSPSSTLSNLIQTIGENTPDVAGTLVQSEGLPSVVVLNMKQYEAVKKIFGIFPAVAKEIHARVDRAFELRKIGEEVLNKVCRPLSSIPVLLFFGTLMTIGGGFFMGMAHQEKKETDQPRSWGLITVGAGVVGLGVACIGYSALIAHIVARSCGQLGEAFAKSPI